MTGVIGPGGVEATFHTGPLPTPSGTLTVTVPPTNSAINGGSVMVTVDAGSTQIVNVYVSVQGTDGYWSVTVPPGSTLADLLLTIARQLPTSVGSITIVFEVQDAAGNISAPVTMVIAVTHVGTGDLQVSLAFDVDNDLDLHVVDPNGFEIYWLDDTSPEGGVLDLDSNPGCASRPRQKRKHRLADRCSTHRHVHGPRRQLRQLRWGGGQLCRHGPESRPSRPDLQREVSPPPISETPGAPDPACWSRSFSIRSRRAERKNARHETTVPGVR